MDEKTALATAQEIASAAGSTAMPRRATDSDYGDACFVAIEGEVSAVVVYLDEPDIPVSTGNHPGRFTAA